METKRLALLPTNVSVTLFAAGPALSVWMVMNYLNTHLLAGEAPFAAIAVLLFWSPFFFSIPAMVLQDARDSILPEMRGLNSVKRAFLLPAEMLKSSNGIRKETLASYIGLALGALVIAPQLAGVVSALS